MAAALGAVAAVLGTEAAVLGTAVEAARVEAGGVAPHHGAVPGGASHLQTADGTACPQTGATSRPLAAISPTAIASAGQTAAFRTSLRAGRLPPSLHGNATGSPSSSPYGDGGLERLA